MLDVQTIRANLDAVKANCRNRNVPAADPDLNVSKVAGSAPYSSAATSRGYGRSGSATPTTTTDASGANTPPNPSRKSSGVPITMATSASDSATPRAREKHSSWSAGTQPRPSPFRKTGIRSSSTNSRSASSPRPQYSPVPAMTTGRSAWPNSEAAPSTASPSAPRPCHGSST